jgi:hypothetical protein
MSMHCGIITESTIMKNKGHQNRNPSCLLTWNDVVIYVLNLLPSRVHVLPLLEDAPRRCPQRRMIFEADLSS